MILPYTIRFTEDDLRLVGKAVATRLAEYRAEMTRIRTALHDMEAGQRRDALLNRLYEYEANVDQLTGVHQSIQRCLNVEMG